MRGFLLVIGLLTSLFGSLTLFDQTAETATKAAADVAPPDLKPLHVAIKKLVVKHYPDADITLKDGTIYFEFKTRKFFIHEPTLKGEWQDAFEVVGPNKGGIVGSLEFQPGQYAGMAVVPQSFDKRYFVTDLMAPYSEKLDGHLMIRLSYPRDVAPKFLKEFQGLVNKFDEYVSEGT